METGDETLPLTFPTQAEQVVQQFEAATKTTSLAKLAKQMGAMVEKQWDRTIYTFDDDTSIEVKGRGRSHQYETQLP